MRERSRGNLLQLDDYVCGPLSIHANLHVLATSHSLHLLIPSDSSLGTIVQSLSTPFSILSLVVVNENGNRYDQVNVR